jgi:vacuolar-type H+-ATPase subunit I/STV1
MSEHNEQTKKLQFLIEKKVLTPLERKQIKNKYKAIQDFRNKAQKCSDDIDETLSFAMVRYQRKQN